MAELMDKLRKEQAAFFRKIQDCKLFPVKFTMSSNANQHIVAEGKKCINYISNNYLGLSGHPEVINEAKKAIDIYGTGMTGSPIMSGTTELHHRLWNKIAKIYGKEAATTFPSGYTSMLGAFQGALSPRDIALVDSYAHRSLVDGAVLSGAKRCLWEHNNMESLEKMLKNNADYKRKLIVIDSVYSMDGDIANLPEILKLKQKYDALLLIDEAHSLGVIGKNGGGLFDYFNMSSESVEIVAGTFSKSAGAVGGFIAASKDYIDFIESSAPANLFTAALPPYICASVLKALDIMETDKTLHNRLWRNIKYISGALRSLGYDIGKTKTAIIPVFIRSTEKALKFSYGLFANNIIATAVAYPVVPRGLERIRMGISALHSKNDLDRTIEVYKVVGKKLGII